MKAIEGRIKSLSITILKYGAATQIIVTEFNELFKKFQVVNRIEIARGDFTYDNAVKKIIELNDIYDPQFIYIDRGHGEVA